MRIFVPTILLLLLAGLVGCSALPHRKPAPDADYGPPPQNYEKLISDYVKDSWWGEQGYHTPQRFGRLRKAYRNRGIIYGGGVDFVGYVVPFSIIDAEGGRWKALAFLHSDTVDYVEMDTGRATATLHYVD